MQEWLNEALKLAKEIVPSIDAPYIDFYFFTATPALVLCVIYFVILTIVSFCDVIQKRIELKFLKWNEYSEGRKISIMRSMCGFIVGSIVCWIAPPFFLTNSLLVKTFENYLQYEPIIFVGIFLFLCSALLTAKNKHKHI